MADIKNYLSTFLICSYFYIPF